MSTLPVRPSDANQNSFGSNGSALSPGEQTRIPCSPLIVSGVDTLEVSLSLKVENFGTLERFRELKKAVQGTMSPSVPVNFGQEEFFRWNLQRTGTKLYPYVLKSGDVSLLLSTRNEDSQIPNAKVEIGSVSCQEDAFGIYRKVLMWLKVYGFEHKSNIVSRIDLCVDTIKQHIDGLGCSCLYRWVRRGRKFFTYYDGNDLESIQIGKGDIVLRVYDKIKELRKDAIKRDFFFDLWGFTEEEKEDPPAVTRVEFQLRRPALKDFDIDLDTVEQIEVNLDAIWQYCTQDWARLANRSVNLERLQNNQSRIPSCKFWKNLQLAIFHRPIPAGKREKKTLHKDLTALREQARGCLLNIAAAAGHVVDDYFGIMATVQNAIQEEFDRYMVKNQEKFEKLFKIRRNEVFVGF